MDNCIFCKIINKEVPSNIVYEDESVISFRDINPVAPIHILVVPKKHIDTIVDLDEEDQELVGKVFSAINKIAKQEKIDEKGFRVVINCKEDGGQEVKHIHFHIIGGKKLGTKICE